jgi:hypothetical protein
MRVRMEPTQAEPLTELHSKGSKPQRCDLRNRLEQALYLKLSSQLLDQDGSY